MEEIPRCIVCGEYASSTLAESWEIAMCKNVVCYHTTLEIIKEALQDAARGEV